MIDIKFVEKYVEPLIVKRKEIITNIGCKENYLYYIQKGLVRKHGYDDNGDAFTYDFIAEGDVVNSYESYILGTPSKFIVEAETDCVLYRFSREMRKDIINSTSEDIDRFIRMIELMFLNKLKRKILFTRGNNTFEVFKLLLDDKAHLFENVQKKHIASYLDVAPQTISRWLKEISMQKSV